MRIQILGAMLALLWGAPAFSAEIYQCVDANGRKTFSQRPCSASAKKTTITGPTAIGTVTPDATAVRTGNRLRDIERELARKQDEVDRLNSRLSEELNDLRYQRRFAANNLAGATWEQSLATEMQAVTQKYKTQVETRQKEMEALHRERGELLRANSAPEAEATAGPQASQ